MLKKVIAAAAAAALVTSPIAAARPAPAAEVLPATEQVDGQPFLNTTAGPLLMFLLIVAAGVGVALLMQNGDEDQPASP